MRIAWFTSFSTESAIGRCGALIATQLRRHAEVDIWHPATDKPRQTEVRSVPFRSALAVDLKALAEYDVVVYNFGNHLPFHREIFLLSQRLPGICILHDFVMHHFFAAYYLEDLRSPDAYISTMRRLYGEQGLLAAEAAVAGRWRVWESDAVVDFPLFEETLGRAYGVVTHSTFFLERVRKVYAGPVRKLSLPYDTPRGPVSLTRADLGVPEEHVLLVTVGHVNANKRIHAVIQALANCPALRGRITYAVLGPHGSAYLQQLVAQVEQCGVQSAVRFLGYVPDNVLQAYMAHADICVNLRFPAFEGASASAIEEMLFGKPVVVTNTGFYSELPDDCVWKIDPDREDAALTAAIQRLATDAEARAALGTRAKSYAQEQFRAERYATEFLRFVRDVRSARPIFELTDRLAAELNVLGVSPRMEIVRTLGRECHELLCGAPSPDESN